jgi:hypothetical protein
MRRCRGELPAAADLGSGEGLSSAAADLVKVAAARAVQQELQSSGGGRGTMPAGLARWAARQLAPAVVPWPKVLRAAVRRAVEDQAGQVHHSWRRPNRRAPKGVLLPTLRAPKIAVDLLIDTSGSMGEDDLAAALSETRAVLRRTGARVRVLCCDAAATAPRPVRSISDVTLTGGGGTDLRVGIDAALAARPAANVIVAFTDSPGISTLCGFRFIAHHFGPSSQGPASSQGLCFGSLVPTSVGTHSPNTRFLAVVLQSRSARHRYRYSDALGRICQARLERLSSRTSRRCSAATAAVSGLTDELSRT